MILQINSNIIVFEIFLLLDFRARARLGQTCKYFNELVTTNPLCFAILQNDICIDLLEFIRKNANHITTSSIMRTPNIIPYVIKLRSHNLLLRDIYKSGACKSQFLALKDADLLRIGCFEIFNSGLRNEKCAAAADYIIKVDCPILFLQLIEIYKNQFAFIFIISYIGPKINNKYRIYPKFVASICNSANANIDCCDILADFVIYDSVGIQIFKSHVNLKLLLAFIDYSFWPEIQENISQHRDHVSIFEFAIVHFKQIIWDNSISVMRCIITNYSWFDKGDHTHWDKDSHIRKFFAKHVNWELLTDYYENESSLEERNHWQKYQSD